MFKSETGTRHILLLDDDSLELNNTKTFIESNILSIEVIAINSYEEAIYYIRKYNQNIKAYILDIELYNSKFFFKPYCCFCFLVSYFCLIRNIISTSAGTINFICYIYSVLARRT